MLTHAELSRGWVEFECLLHGFLAAGAPSATVTCVCGQRATRARGGHARDSREVPRKTRQTSLPHAA